jgi:hypothetical protein
MSSEASTLTGAGAASGATNWAPTAKVSVGLLAGSMAALLLPLWKKLGLESPEAIASITTILTFMLQYLVPEREKTK